MKSLHGPFGLVQASFLDLSPDEIDGQCNLGYQDQRNTHGELDMLGLVPDGVHAKQASDAAAQGGHGHQGGFRDPPAVMFGFPLVDEHKHKANCID